MNQSTRIFASIIVVSIILVISTFAEKLKPLTQSGTVSLSTTSIAVGVGVNWGRGVLTFKGKEYPFTVKGLSVMDLGISKASAKGEVFHLVKVADFAGKYASIEAAFALGKGNAGLVMKNSNGVVISLGAVTKGVQLTLGGKGLSIKLQEK